MGPLSEPIGSAEAQLTEQSSFHIGRYHVPPTPRFVRRSGASVDKNFSQVRTRTRKSIMLERRSLVRTINILIPIIGSRVRTNSYLIPVIGSRVRMIS